MTETYTPVTLARWLEEYWIPDLEEAGTRPSLVLRENGPPTPVNESDRARWRENAARFRHIAKLLREK